MIKWAWFHASIAQLISVCFIAQEAAEPGLLALELVPVVTDFASSYAFVKAVFEVYSIVIIVVIKAKGFIGSYVSRKVDHA